MKKPAFAFGLCLLLLAACSTHKKEAAGPVCPAIGFVPGARHIAVIAGDNAHSAAGDIASEGRILSVTGGCSYKKQGELLLDITLNFAGRRGAKGPGLSGQQFPYFISVLSSDDQILQRTEFTTGVNFDKTGVGTSSEDHRIRIPLKDAGAGPSYKIAVGFRLTPRQLDYNRENNEN